jgi:hypothetical protein
MTTVFVAGSMKIKRLDPRFVDRLANVVSSNLNIVVGDAGGSDASIQAALLAMNSKLVVVYCSGPQPRNNLGSWRVHSVFSDAEEGTRAYFTAKDVEMANVADFGLMIWDAKSTGTLSNVLELLRRGKKCVVFVNKNKMFITVAGIDGLNQLVETMSEGARAEAERKVGLISKIASIAHEQFSLPL